MNQKTIESAGLLYFYLHEHLNEHLHEIDVQAREQVEWIIDQTAARMGVDETLKSADPMRWAQEMNSIKASAEEIILAEFVYC